MRGIKCYCFLLLLCARLDAQISDPHVDEMLVQVYSKELRSLSLMVNAGQVEGDHRFCQLDAHTRYSRPGSLLYFSKESFSYSGARRDHYLQMCALEAKANTLYGEKKYGEALSYWKAALGISIQDHFLMYELHYIRVAINNIYFLLGELQKAMEISTAGLSASEKAGDQERVAHFSNVLGCIFLKLNNPGAARPYFENELRMGKVMEDGRVIAHAMLNLADLYQQEGNFKEAVHAIQMASAEYERVKPYDLEERRTYCRFKIAESLKRWGKDSEAMYYSRIVMRDVEKVHGINLYDKANYAINAGELFLEAGKTDSALSLLHFALALARSIRHREYTRDAFRQLANVFKAKGDMDSAYWYQQNYYDLRDSLLNENNERVILQRDGELQLEKQSKTQQLALAEQKIWRNIAIAIAAMALLVLAFFYNRNRLRRKNMIQLEQLRRQNELFNVVADTQEQERKRIAQDLHDSLGTVLSAAKLKLGALKDAIPDPVVSEHFQEGINLIDEASSELRNISHDIMPASLSKLGLIPALKNLCGRLSSKQKLQIELITSDFRERLEERIELSVYRILLELINNIIKHSSATHATVQLIRFPQYLHLSVEDDGKGFSMEQIHSQNKGIGLGNVATRVEYLAGKMDVETSPGKGTSIFIDIPL